MSIQVEESRTAANGLAITMFIAEPSEGSFRTETRFVAQGGPGESPIDPRPYLCRAISALSLELAEVDNCPVHRRVVIDPETLTGGSVSDAMGLLAWALRHRSEADAFDDKPFAELDEAQRAAVVAIATILQRAPS